MKGRLVIISAPSGAGKTTIVKKLLDAGLGLEFSVSAATRAMRQGETDGKDYFFLSPDEFRRRVANNEFVEWEEVYKDHYYGTLKCEIERIQNSGKHVLFDLDVKGGINMKRIFGQEAVSLFIKPPSVEELERRLTKRGTDTAEKIKMRIEKAAEEMKQATLFDYVVVNDNLERATGECLSIIRSFLS